MFLLGGQGSGLGRQPMESPADPALSPLFLPENLASVFGTLRPKRLIRRNRVGRREQKLAVVPAVNLMFSGLNGFKNSTEIFTVQVRCK